MPYESFVNNNQGYHITVDNVVSCIVITIYIGAMGWFVYKYIKEYV